MPDSFDTNIAKRMPNVTSKPRPVHPWDVSDLPNDTDHQASVEKPLKPKKPHAATPKHKEVKSDSAFKKRLRQNRETSDTKPSVSPKHKVSDLSNSINIHSNFCKLDNDVSDRLFSLLSASAQSVYLRLYRQSIGWNRNWAAESLPKLTKACNLSLQTIRKAIKELESLGCIRKEFSDYHKATVYRVFLPSEINIGIDTHSNTAMVLNRGQIYDSQIELPPNSDSQIISVVKHGTQNSDSDKSYSSDLKNLEGNCDNLRGQESDIQSIYFAGTSIYKLLESARALPKNISKYMTYTHLATAVHIIDEFYDSIGFSIVSRATYRKSLIDYFDLIKSGFSHDDIRYAVRWTFRNSRTRPESFSLIKHTMHLAMDDLIKELKTVSGEKELAEEKKASLKKTIEWEKREHDRSVSNDDMKLWLDIVGELKNSVNEHSFRAFIEPLKLVSVDGDSVTLSAPPDSLSWIVDHYQKIIEDTYCEKTSSVVSVHLV